MNGHWTICVTGVSGGERTKGSLGVGKSLLCNRFVRPHYDDLYLDHSSTLSQTDFFGSPVINNDHWLYWGERIVSNSDDRHIQVTVIEQTEFIDDETFEPLLGSRLEPYDKRCSHLRLESRDKLMYIRQEQLGTEADWQQKLLPEGRVAVDSFLFVFDMSSVPGRSLERQSELAVLILNQLLKTKRPIVVAAAKFDAVEEGARATLDKLMARKNLRDIPVVEVSAVRNVNVEAVFMIGIGGGKGPRPRPFRESLAAAHTLEKETRQAYSSLLHALVSCDRWPSQRAGWGRLVGEMGLGRNPSFLRFRALFGEDAARRAYERHVQEIREECIRTRLRSLLPALPAVFASLLLLDEAVEMEWDEAKNRLLSHALFDSYFLPLGTLGRLLDPIASTEDLFSKPDSRLPAEMLFRSEAKSTFERWKDDTRAKIRHEKLEEELERFLSTCTQVTPGRPLAQVRLLLGETGGPLDLLPASETAAIYDRFQRCLVVRAEADLAECLHEHVEAFVEIAVSRRDLRDQPTRGPPQHLHLSQGEMADLRMALQEDIRYRNLGGVSERRDSMVRERASFLAMPLSRRCPANVACMDTISTAILQHFVSRRRQLVREQEVVHLVVYGHPDIIRLFIREMQKGQTDTSLASHLRYVRVECSEGRLEEGEPESATKLFLVHSRSYLTPIGVFFKGLEGSPSDHGASIFAVACPEEDYHLIPILQKEIGAVAESVGGVVMSVKGDTESPSPFPRHLLVSLAETALDAVESRRRFLRVQMSILCGEGPPPLELLQSLLAPPSFRLLNRWNELEMGVLPMAVEKCAVRVDVRVASYHSWLCTGAAVPVHAHVVVYSASRRASWSHARAAVRRILEEGDDTLTGRAVAIVAIADDVTDFFRHQETSVLLTEGAELAASVGATFLCVSCDGRGEGAPQMAAFLQKVSEMFPTNQRSNTCTLLRRDTKSSDGYGRWSVIGPPASIHPPMPIKDTLTYAPSPRLPPLATPEPLDIAVDYSTVQRYSSDEDYAKIRDGVVDSSVEFPHRRAASPPRQRQPSTFLAPRLSTSLGPRSLTVALIPTEAVAAARLRVGRAVKHSLSTENLHREDTGIVNKIKSSFRRKKEREGATSLPQSPALGRRAAPNGKKGSLPLPPKEAQVSWASAGISWLAGKSTQRRRKDLKDDALSSSLSSMILAEGTSLPLFVVNAVNSIEKSGGLMAEGIYRLSGTASQQEEVEERLRKEEVVGDVDVYAVGVALKNFCSRLSDPVVPRALQKGLLAATDEPDSMREILRGLPSPNVALLRFLLEHLERVAGSKSTAMTAANLAIVWVPSLLQPQFTDLETVAVDMDAYKAVVVSLLLNWRFLLPPSEAVTNSHDDRLLLKQS